MSHSIHNGVIYITTDNYTFDCRVEQFNKILESAILSELSMNDLNDIWKDLFGIPSNILDFLLKKVSLYDSSSEVNTFYYKDKSYWFDKVTRASLINLANFSDEFTLIIGDEEVTMTSEKAKEFLARLEKYAQETFINTQKHIKAIKAIPYPTSTEEVQEYFDAIINYDYTTGYPEKITLE